MVKFQDLFNRYLFFGLFILASLSFIITIQGDNDAAQPLGADPRISGVLDDLGGNISAANDTSQTQYINFINEQPKLGFGSIVLFGIVAVGKTTGTIVSNFFTIIITLPLVILGIDQNIINVLMIWASISVVVALWLLYKLGG